MDLKKFAQIKKQLDDTQREVDKAAGALEQLMQELRKDFGCKTLEEGEALLSKLKKQEKILGAEFDTSLERFAKDWDEKTQGLPE